LEFSPLLFTDGSDLALERDPEALLAHHEITDDGRCAATGAELGAERELVFGLVLLVQGRYREVEQRLVDYGSESAALNARALLSRAEALVVLGEAERARKLGEEARALFSQGGDRLACAWADITLANAHHHNLDASGVEEVFDAARRVCRSAGAEIRAARADVSCANALTYQGLYSRALERYERARAVFTRFDLPRRRAVCDLNRANLHQMRGELREAVSAGEAARDLFRQYGLKTHAAFCETNLSEVLLDLNRNVEALDVAGSAAQFFASQGMVFDRAIVQINQARALERTGELELARATLEEAGLAFQAQGAAVYAGLVEIEEAVLDLRQQQSEAARLRAAKARRILRRHAPYVGYAMLVEARALEESAPAEALAIYRQAVAHGVSHDLAWLSYRARHRVSVLLARAGDLEGAREEADACVRSIEEARSGLAGDLAKTAFVADKAEAFEHALRLHWQAGDGAATLRALEAAKSAALADLLRSRGVADHVGASLAPPIRALWRQFVRVRADYAAQVSAAAAAAELEAGGEDATGENESVDAPMLAATRRSRVLAEEYDRLRRRLVVSGREDLLGLDGAASLDATTLAGLLRPGEVLLDYYLLDRRTIGVLVTVEGRICCRDCGDARSLCSQIGDEWLAEIVDFSMLDPAARTRHAALFQDAAKEILDSLGHNLLQPFAEQLCDVSSRRVVVAPHGLLHALPVAALRLEGASLCERLESSVTPSAAVLATLESALPTLDPAKSLVLAVADREAPEIAHEGRVVADLLANGHLLEGASATLEAFQREAPTVHLLHVASHGDFTAASPMGSALRLADGPLRVVDLYRLAGMAPLVVLSGCETGRSRVRPGDELIGLVRGFLFAGARSVVASLWRVDDQVSAELMSLFYRALLRGRSVAAALREAQREIAESYLHPFYWAGFAVFGRGDLRLG
jgi:hypothetical protein